MAKRKAENPKRSGVVSGAGANSARGSHSMADRAPIFPVRVLSDQEMLEAVDLRLRLFSVWDIARHFNVSEACVAECLAFFDKDALMRSTIKVSLEKEDMLAELKQMKKEIWRTIKMIEGEHVVTSHKKGIGKEGNPIDETTTTRENRVAPASYYAELSRINKQIAELLGLDEIQESAGQVFAILKMPDNKRNPTLDSEEADQ